METEQGFYDEGLDTYEQQPFLKTESPSDPVEIDKEHHIRHISAETKKAVNKFSGELYMIRDQIMDSFAQRTFASDAERKRIESSLDIFNDSLAMTDLAYKNYLESVGIAPDAEVQRNLKVLQSEAFSLVSYAMNFSPDGAAKLYELTQSYGSEEDHVDA